MATRKSKKIAEKEQYQKQIKSLIENGFDLFEIQELLGLDNMKRILNYCAEMEMVPIVGEIDLNWYINGFFIYSKQAEKKKQEEDFKKSYKPNFNWFNDL